MLLRALAIAVLSPACSGRRALAQLTGSICTKMCASSEPRLPRRHKNAVHRRPQVGLRGRGGIARARSFHRIHRHPAAEGSGTVHVSSIHFREAEGENNH
jgi:hypothetical protein